MHSICAISTAYGVGGIAVIRVSGEGSIAIVDGLFRGRVSLAEAKGGTVHYGCIERNGEVLDEVIALVMRAPHTYTTEDVVELSCHGGPLVLQRVLEELVAAGARLAEPGEFTKRAYLGGRRLVPRHLYVGFLPLYDVRHSRRRPGHDPGGEDEPAQGRYRHPGLRRGMRFCLRDYRAV